MPETAQWMLVILMSVAGLGGLALRMLGRRAGALGRFFAPRSVVYAEMAELEQRQIDAEDQAALLRVRHAWLAQRAQTEQVVAKAHTAAATAREDGHTEWANSVDVDAAEMEDRIHDFDERLDALETVLHRAIEESLPDVELPALPTPQDRSAPQ